VLADNVPALFSYLDTSGRYRFVNKRYEEWFGIPRTEIIGRHYRQVLGEAAYERIRDHVERALLGQQVRFEDALPYRNGGTRWVNADYVPDTDDRGKVKGFFALVTDITDCKRAEEALRESEERFRRLAEASFEGIAIHDKGKILDANQTLATMFGHELPEFIGMHVLDLTAPESRGPILRKMLSRSEDPFEAVGLRKDGSTFVGEIRGKAIPYQGRLVSVAAIRDITDRKRAEAALRESTRRYRLLAENATDIIWIRDLNLRTTYVNPAVTRIRGYSVEEVMTQPLEEVLTPASVKLARKALAEELAQEEVEGDLSWQRTLELEATRKDGSTVWLDVKVAALRDDDGRIVGVLGISRDISERKQAEEVLLEAREDLMDQVERGMSRGNAYGLTFRELTVLHQVAAGKSDKEIASTLGISTLTASKHLANILHKMGAASRTEAGVRAVRERLLD
jgi:PAS domain S-box-containing protein